MKRYFSCVMIALLATIAGSNAATPDKAAMEAKEKAAWQAFKDKNEAEFKKVVDKDFRGVYDEGISNMQKELDDMKKWDMSHSRSAIMTYSPMKKMSSLRHTR